MSKIDEKAEAYRKQCEELRAALANEIAALIEVNWPAIDRIRTKEGQNGEVAVAMQIKIGGSGALTGHVKMAYAEKYTDEGDVQVADPSQPELPG